MNDWKKKSNYSDLKKLEDKLCVEDDRSLLARNYMYWSEERNGPVSKTVNNVMEDGVKLREEIPDIIKNKKIRRRT